MEVSSSHDISNIDQPKEVLFITIRFTNSFDLPLDILEPSQTTVIALKQAVRLKLEPSLSKHRFRFIHSGKLLRDDDILSEVLKIPQAPPRTPDPSGDVLTPAELSAEGVAASLSYQRSRERMKYQNGNRGLLPEKTTTISPRGFDRLLSGGFTAAEVNQLRLQFRSIQQSIHTPDTMPSPNTMLRIEDAWIDDNSSNGSGSPGFDFGDDSLGGGAIDDILWGNLIGFFWPLGCVGFLMRESGVWSRRRKIAIFTGFILNMAFGILRVMS